MVPSASIGGFLVLAIWLERHLRADVAWEASALVCAFAAVLPAFVEVARHRDEEVAPAIANWAVLTPVAGIVLLVGSGASTACPSPWPWLAGWTLLGIMAFREAGLPGRGPLHLALAVVLGVAFPVLRVAHLGVPGFPAAPVWMAGALVPALGFLVGALRHRDALAARWAAHGAATLALILLVGALPGGPPPPPIFVYAHTLALAAVALIVAARLGNGGWSFAAALTAAFVQTSWSFVLVPAGGCAGSDLPGVHAALAGQGLAVVLVASWPLIAGRRLQDSLWAWRSAALAAPLWFFGLDHAWRAAFGTHAIGLLPISLGLVTLAVALLARPRLPEEVQRSALVWLLGVTVASVSLAVPLQLENEWVTVGWALEGLALLALWRRIDHAGLKYTALGHLAVVAARLTLQPLGARLPPSVRRARPQLARLHLLAPGGGPPRRLVPPPRSRGRPLAFLGRGASTSKGRPAWAMSAAAAAIVVFFVWINLTIFDAFGTGRDVEVVFERLPARDLTLSLAWALYALALLGVGMARRSAALRWASLCLIIVTIGKVFLYDLSHLHDLYRVMSLVGLALSLILISLLYQRFVFGKRVEGAA